MAADAPRPPGEVSQSVEGLLQELDDLRARLLEQHRRELEGKGCQGRLSSALSSMDSEADPFAPAVSAALDHQASSDPADFGDRSSEPVVTMRATRPQRHNARFVLLESWNDKVPPGRLAEFDQTGKARNLLTTLSRDSSVTTSQHGDEIVFMSFWSRIVVHPQATPVIAWRILSLLLIAYDTLTVPLYTFYTFEQFPKAIYILDWIARIFWTADMPLSSATGIYKEGYLELRLGKVFLAYLRSWFLFDLLIVSTDWLVILASVLSERKALSAVPVLRGLRFVRVLRLLRLGRLTHLVSEMLLHASDGVTILVRVLKLTVGLCISIHLIASIWFGLGTMSDSGWVSQEPLMDSAGLSAQYLISVNWVVTQLQGTSLVRPRTLLEVSFQTLVLLGANAFVAVFVASTVQAMMTLTDPQSLQMQCVCRRYLRRRHISPELSHKLQLHFGKASVRGSLQDSAEVEKKLVESLPLVLQQQVYEEVRLPLLNSTQLFRMAGLSNYRLLRQLCYDAVAGLYLEPGVLVFTRGDCCSRMLVVESGTSVYIPLGWSGEGSVMNRDTGRAVASQALATTGSLRTQNSLPTFASRSHSSQGSRERASRPQRTQLHRGQCLCEASLWTRWTNRGELSSEGDCTMLAVDQEHFAAVVTKYEFVYMSALRYANSYVLWLNSRSPEHGVSDLMDPPRDLREYVPLPTDTSSPFVFISHFKEEAGSDAALMEEGISRMIKDDPSHPAFRFNAPTFLDSNNLDDIRLLRNVVRSSHNLLLLLTDRVLERPWVLIEIVTAMKSGVPIQLVQIQRPGVDFQFPTQRDIKRLAAGKGLSSDAKAILKAEKITASDMEAIGQIFGKIALPFSPHRSLTVRQAELQDILSRCELCTIGRSVSSPAAGRRRKHDDALPVSTYASDESPTVSRQDNVASI